MSAVRKQNRYSEIMEHVFFKHHSIGASSFEFTREEFTSTAREIGVKLPKNIGDVIYAFRYRSELPQSIRDTSADGFEWIILGAGRARYKFVQMRLSRIIPRTDLIEIKIPDATPEIILAYALGDEQALLAIVRYNRLIDIFLGITASSLQNHLRTTVKDVGQIEVDEIYVGLDRNGCHYVIPVQAKGGDDMHGAVQTMQDVACCKEKFPNLICRPVSAQFMGEDRIAMFELFVDESGVLVVNEKHYKLVGSSEITVSDLRKYRMFSSDL